MAICERDRALYAAEEKPNGCRLRAYSIRQDGSLLQKAEKEYGFFGISHLSVSRDGRFLWVAAYGCSAIAAVSLRDGCPSDVAAWKTFPGHGANRERQEASHPHFVLETKEGQLFVPDLGTDKIHRLILEEKQDHIFTVSYDLSNELALTQPGDKVALEYMDDPSGICSASSFDNLGFDQSGQ